MALVQCSYNQSAGIIYGVATLIILTGLPGTGKSSILPLIASKCGVPYISKDDIKETIADTFGIGDRSLSIRYGEASFSILYRLVERNLAAGISIIAETYFHGIIAAENFKRIRSNQKCKLIQIVLTCEAKELLRRFRNRSFNNERHLIHNDEFVYGEIEKTISSGDYNGLRIKCPTVFVDTTVINDQIPEKIYDFICVNGDIVVKKGNKSDRENII